MAAAVDLNQQAQPPICIGDPADAQTPSACSKCSPRDFRFWAIIIALGTVSLLSAAENTVVVTFLPTIVEGLGVGQNYVWIGNVRIYGVYPDRPDLGGRLLFLEIVQILVPLLVGAGGLVPFVAYEGLPSATEQVMPLRMFSDRAAVIVYAISFLNSLRNYWSFFVPIYFQASRGLNSAQLPAFQASIKEAGQAAATGSWSFIRSFGNIRGVTISAAIFNSFTVTYAQMIDNPRARASLTSGNSLSWNHSTNPRGSRSEPYLRRHSRRCF
ncbi:hypothetical protein F4820DRAFT_453465 [Hypoxylon rubiginosum]|uniref:Uncharacterized protein n=1 Tax=Hypoxylon rubiginosum TaxID=110542 RepID=A0ACB9YKE1_9PEZI|nr:hypothetical protein F4820DRAFT_453465 [Hypoxylon rubiginosum]